MISLSRCLSLLSFLIQAMQLLQLQMTTNKSKISTTKQSKIKDNKTVRDSVILSDDKQQQNSWFKRCCGWADLTKLKPYFQVTTQSVKTKIIATLKFWVPEYLKVDQPDPQKPQKQQNSRVSNSPEKISKIQQDALKEYDIYGPFWIITTLVFCLTAIHNILAYLNLSASTFAFNFSILGVGFVSMYIMGFGFPTLLTFVMKCFAGAPDELTYISMVSMHGYTHVVSIFAVVLCIVNVTILQYIFLLYAVGSRTWYIFSNVKKINLNNRKMFIYGLIAVEAIVMFILFKFVFVVIPSQPAAPITTSHLLHHKHLVTHT